MWSAKSVPISFFSNFSINKHLFSTMESLLWFILSYRVSVYQSEANCLASYVWKIVFMKTLKNDICMSFVDVSIPNCIHSLNTLLKYAFYHPVSTAKQNSESFPMLALEKQSLSPELFPACRVLQLSKNELEYNEKTPKKRNQQQQQQKPKPEKKNNQKTNQKYQISFHMHTCLWFKAMVLAKNETEKASFNRVVKLTVAYYLVLLKYFNLWLKT